MEHMKYDHFHCLFKDSNGNEGEIEGGWVGFPNNYKDMNDRERLKWQHGLACAWGMPKKSTIIRIWLAG